MLLPPPVKTQLLPTTDGQEGTGNPKGSLEGVFKELSLLSGAVWRGRKVLLGRNNEGKGG